MQIFVINGISDDTIWDVHAYEHFEDAKKEFDALVNDYLKNEYKPDDSFCDDVSMSFDNGKERFWIEEVTLQNEYKEI